MKKVGIMGGTFDPIHIGHLIAAEQARDACGLDEVWFIPTHSPPHKHAPTGASPDHRLAMVRLAIADYPPFRLSDLEIRRGGVSYTIDTVERLTADRPDTQFAYIIGADMVEYLPRWHRIEEIAAKITFIGLARPGYTLDGELPEWLRRRVTTVEIPLIDISSTAIRARIRAGRSVRFLIPPPVQAYIEENGLYV
jgi:nicotinate-nucleotide adenylyltransferase